METDKYAHTIYQWMEGMNNRSKKAPRLIARDTEQKRRANRKMARNSRRRNR